MLGFFYDILVYSKDWEEHLQHLTITFKLLQENQLLLKKPKCCFGYNKIHYLGHVITREGVQMDRGKVQAILDWPVPRSVKALREFLGLTGDYR